MFLAGEPGQKDQEVGGKAVSKRAGAGRIGAAPLELLDEPDPANNALTVALELAGNALEVGKVSFSTSRPQRLAQYEAPAT
jgi:hypothetical protein